MAKIFSIPPFPDETTGANEDSQFGYFECQHGPTPRQNAVAWETLTCKDLTPEGKTQQLAPQKIAARLWTAHRLVDEESKIMLTDTTDPSKEHKSRQSGSAASTTIYDGKGNLTTATLGDTSAFLVFYDYEGNPMAARRLNSVIHRLDNLDEYARIKKEGGIIAHDKLVLRENDAEISSLAVSRAMGSEQFKKSGVCANSNLDIVNLAEAAKDLGIAQEKIAKTQVISVCHSFNEAAGTNNQTKEGHENHLLSALKELDTPATSQEADLARLLIERVKPNTSDNLSVAIQTINKDTPAFLLGLYGGQQGVVVSALAAYFTGDFFKKQCALTGEAYATQKLSVNSNKLVYKRDNPDLFNESEYKAIVLKLSALTRTYQKNLDSNGSEHIAPLLKLLVAILENPYETNKTKIKKFYDFLDSPHSTTALKNIEILKQDEKIPTLNFILGICFVLISLATFIIPSLFISGFVYAATDRSPFDLFNSYGEQYSKELTLMETRSLKKYEGFFRLEPPKKEQSESDAPQLTF